MFKIFEIVRVKGRLVLVPGAMAAMLVVGVGNTFVQHSVAAEPGPVLTAGPLNPDPNLDTDSDGISDANEIYRYGTDYNVADSDSDGLLDGEEVHLRNTDPMQWDTDGDKLGDGEEVMTTFSDPTQLDSDGDGLNDNVEAYEIGTSPTQIDSDGGGIDDGSEVRAGTDPLHRKDDVVDTPF